jgi:hypothetical protein
MDKKVGRNDPCPCGSGKKYKNCCQAKEQSTGPKKFTAKLLSKGADQTSTPKNLIEKTFGFALAKAEMQGSYQQPTSEEAAEVLPAEASTTDEDPISSSPI